MTYFTGAGAAAKSRQNVGAAGAEVPRYIGQAPLHGRCSSIFRSKLSIQESAKLQTPSFKAFFDCKCKTRAVSSVALYHFMVRTDNSQSPINNCMADQETRAGKMALQVTDGQQVLSG